MALKRLEINGYRSIDNVDLEGKQIVTLIGENGCGKSNILSAIEFFYKNLIKEWEEKGNFDVYNTFRNEISIRITYDLKNILRISNYNLKCIQEGKEGYKKFYQKIQGIATDDEIVLELRKRKGRPVKWNVPYNTRQIIATVFPIYFVDARQIMLTDWSNLWNLIGDLLKLRNEESYFLREEITNIVMHSDQKTRNKIEQLEKILEEKRINVRQLTSGELGKIISELILGGQMFQYGERNLKEHSNGTNSFNYILFLIEILDLIKRYKMKEPIVILDEPEISLHNIMLDSLMERIIEASQELQFFLSTHSSRCLKDIMEEEIECRVYHVALKEHYSRVKAVKLLAKNEFRERAIISETYTNTCFAKSLVNVEGETEIELLKNRYLKVVFPFLKEVEIVKGMSNNVVLNLINPDKRNYQTPSVFLLDMDKVLNWKETNRFEFKVPRAWKDKEVYYYGDKRKKTLYLRKRIENMCKKCHFWYNLPLYNCEDPNFKILLELVHEYFENYHYFVLQTTIEGTLITTENLQLFWQFVNQTGLIQKTMNDVSWYIDHKQRNEQLNYVRLVFSGKSDFLLRKRQLSNDKTNINEDIWNNLEAVNKTSGWVSKWMEYYFLEVSGIEKDASDRFRRFCYHLAQGGEREKILRRFRMDFKELYEFLKKVEREKSERR